MYDSFNRKIQHVLHFLSGFMLFSPTLKKTYRKSSDSMFSVSSGMCISLRWGCLLVNEKLKKTNLPQAPRNTHAGRFRVWQLAIFSLPLEHFIPLRIFLIYSHNTTCVLSTVPYQPVHYSLHHAQIECDFWLRERFYSLKLCRFFFSLADIIFALCDPLHPPC